MTDPNTQVPPQVPPKHPGADKKMTAALCGILVGAFGVHKFILGYNTAGIITCCVTVLTCGFGGIAMAIIGIIEGVMYLQKSDEEFYQTYIVGKKEWF